MEAHARVVVDAGPDDRPRARVLRTCPPLGLRMAGGDLHLLGTAAGPLGGDRLHLEVVVSAGVRLTVRSVAASLAQRGDGTPSRSTVAVTVEPGAVLHWLPEPLVAADGCDHESSATVELHGDAGLVWRDELVLGRSGERPGPCSSALRVTVDGRALLHHAVSSAAAGWDGPAVFAGARVVGQLAVVGPPAAGAPALRAALRGPAAPTADASGAALGGLPELLAAGGPRAALAELSDDVLLATALADDHARLRRVLDPVTAAATMAASVYEHAGQPDHPEPRPHVTAPGR